MAYLFWAEKQGEFDPRPLGDRMREFRSVEFFAVDIGVDATVIGMSVPLKWVGDPRFESDVEGAIRLLISDAGFRVFDLFTGNEISLAEVPGLAQRVSR